MIKAALVATLAKLSHAYVRGADSRAAPRGAAAFLGDSQVSLLQRDDDGGYHYMPEEKALICICAKCGSTSLYEFLYAKAFGKEWDYDGLPYIHDVASSRWEGKFEVLNSAAAAEAIKDPGTFSFALMRDPKVRLISSWKSKVACDGTGNWGTDKQDRARMVPKLMDLADGPNATCLSFEEFLETLAAVHSKGRAAELNVHFRPQQHGCFREFAPPQWSRVADIADASAATELARHFGDDRATDFPHEHSSTSPYSSSLNISSKAQDLLNEITREEYAVLVTRKV